MLSKSYELTSGPPPTPVDEYAIRCEERFSALLSNDPSEPEVQSFLEQNPSLVPGPLTPGGPSGHYPLHCSLIAQPKLPGQDLFVPDFMWIATHSGAWFPTLIEIEKPGKRIFNRDGSTTADFTKARNQLENWRIWFNDPINVQQFIDLYGVTETMRRRMMRLHMILIYGRRSEFEGDPLLASRRSALLPGQDEELMSYDRLKVDTSMRPAITVKAIGHGKYRAFCVPSVFEMGPMLANRLLYIEGIPEAVDRNPEIEEDRKEFIKGRIGYWKEWASSGSGVLSSGDRE